MDEARPMLAAQSEVLFTYPTRTGDYDKSGWPLGSVISIVSPRRATKSSRHPACLRPPSAQDRYGFHNVRDTLGQIGLVMDASGFSGLCNINSQTPSVFLASCQLPH